ncbi:uncharacterized protein LOC110978985 isoform X2 [Acanthaster planci]|nr:uncharacterized protein LOC110978985 isoform X2 [Acanthaster planci]
MMMTMTMHWFLWLSVIGSHLRLASSGHLASPLAEVMPSANFTDFVDVTATSKYRAKSILSQANTSNETSVPSTLTETNVDLLNDTISENTTVGISTVQRTVAYIGERDETVDYKESGTSENHQRNPATPFQSPAFEPSTSSLRLQDSAKSTSTEASLVTASFTKTSIDDTSQKPTSQPEKLHTRVGTTSIFVNKNLQDILTPNSQFSKQRLYSSQHTTTVTLNVDTSSSSVPDTTPHHLEGLRVSEASTKTSLTTWKGNPSPKTSKNYELETALPVAKTTSSDFLTSLAKATTSTSRTQKVTEELTTADDRDSGDEESTHEETAYELSLRTRRVINHAALWITIGFVVVLVSYITVLVIYNRMRPDWQDSPHPYSRFENEPDDFQDSNENDMYFENQD